MKKTLAILLALALVFSSVTVAFAEETLPADAKTVTTLGMLTGAGNGVTLDYLKTAPQRIQAALMVLRLKGLDDEALAFTGTDNFADADKAAWAKPIMAYLKAHPEVGFAGVGNNNFDPTKEIDAQSYYKVMLETLGYKANTADVIGDFTWNGVFEFAAKNGLSKVANVLSYTVNDLATATVETLKATVKGSTTKTLGYSLVESKILTVEKAVAAGIYTVPAVTLAVESVTATNLREIIVKFNKEVDKDTVVAANFTIGGHNAAKVALGTDKMTVTVTVADADIQTQPANYELVVQNVKDTAGVKIAKYTNKLRVFDNAIPTVTGMKLVGPNKIELTFSEPVKPGTGTVKINNGVYAVGQINVDANVATVVLSASSLPSATYTVVVSNFQDYALFKVDSTTLSLVYAKDTTLPVATIKSATQTEVKVEFNKPVILDATNTDTIAEDVNLDGINDSDAYEDYFYHTFSTWKPNAVVKSADSKTFTLTFTTYPVPEGTANLVIKYKGTATDSELKDEWGNKLEANITVPVTVTADKTAPAVKEVKVVDEQTVDIYFTEKMDQPKANDDANFVVKDSAAKDVTTSYTATYSEDLTKSEYKVRLLFTSKLDGGNYTVNVKGQEDKALMPNALAAVTLSFTITDLTPVDIATADTVKVTFVPGATADDGETVYITFAEKMATTGEGSVLNAANYLLDLDGTANTAKAPEELDEDAVIEIFGTTGKVVRITLPDTAIISTSELLIGRVADAAGNKIAALQIIEVIGNETLPVVTAVKVTDYNKATVVVNKPLSVVLASGFKTATNEVASIDSWSINKDNETEILVTVNGADAAVAADTSTVFSKFFVVENVLVAETGVKMASGDITTLVKDYRAPKLIAETSTIKAMVDSTATANAFEIHFTEALDARTNMAGLFAHDLVITDKDGKVKVAGVDYQTAIKAGSGNEHIVVVTGLANGKYTVKSKDAVSYIKDNTTGVNNKAAVFTDAREVTIQ